MSQLIREQVFGFIVLFFCGVGMVMLRQLFTAYQNRYKPKKGISIIQEMLFWILGALLVSACLYYSNYGAVSIHTVAGFTLGAITWYNICHIYR
jgi:hypothetical protein